MVAEETTPEQRADIRERGLSVVLGAATALVLALFVPAIGQMGLVSIPLWRIPLGAVRRRHAVSAASAP